MKAKLAAFSLIFVCGISAVAQQKPPEDLRSIGITEQEFQQIQALNEETRQSIQLARAELEVYQARLRRLHVSENPNLDEAESIIRESMEFEVSIRLERTRQEIALRKLLGGAKYDRLREHQDRQRMAAVRDGRGGPGPDRGPGLFPAIVYRCRPHR